jgi:hypothetical protein
MRVVCASGAAIFLAARHSHPSEKGGDGRRQFFLVAHQFIGPVESVLLRTAAALLAHLSVRDGWTEHLGKYCFARAKWKCH